MAALRWQWLAFDAMDARTLYAVLAARQQVFVLEQQCLYPDLDGLDPDALHLLGWRDTQAPDGMGLAHAVQGATGSAHAPQLAAYLRCLAPGVKFAQASLGRVLTTAAARRTGAGRELVQRGIAKAAALYPDAGLRISAQRYLEAFYASLGFVAVSAPYDEDGIAHIDMQR